MWIKSTGDLTEHVLQVTSSVSTHLVIIGDSVGMVDAGIWAVGPELWEKVSSTVESLEFVFLTHAHFDHVGAIPYLKKTLPNLKIVSGRLTAELLSDKDFVETLREKNILASKALGQELDCSSSEWFKSLQVDITLSDGDSVNLGENVEVKLFETPGHTADSVCYYVKPDMALAAGESMGQYSGREKITPSFGSSYSDAMLSFQKINVLDIQILSLPHSGVITGDLVNKYTTELPVEMERFRKSFCQRVNEGELVEEIVASVAAEWADEGRFPEGPFHEAHRELVEMMVKEARNSVSETD